MNNIIIGILYMATAMIMAVKADHTQESLSHQNTATCISGEGSTVCELRDDPHLPARVHVFH